MAKAYWWTVDAAGWALIGRHLNQFRRELNLPAVRRLFRWWTSPELAIGLFPEWYGVPQPDWPPQLKLCGFPLYDGVQQPVLDPELLDFCRAGEPPIAVTFGTGMMHADKLFREVVEACRRRGHRALLLARHPDQIPDDLPEGIRHVPYAPLLQLLPHCAAIIHHGGIGTTAKGLAAGCPQLIIPHAWDQLDNALRVEQLGAGRRLSRRSANARRVTAAIDAVLEPQVSTNCRNVADRFGIDDPLQQAAEWVELLGMTNRVNSQ